MASTFTLLSFTLIAATAITAAAIPPSPTPTSQPTTSRYTTRSSTGTPSPGTSATTPLSLPPISSPPTTPLSNNKARNDVYQHHNDQMNTIIDALIGALDFGSWSNILSSIDPSLIDPSLKTVTLFIPDNDTGIAFDPFLIPYHIIPQQRLSFSDLLHHDINTSLPTLLPGNSLVITNNSGTNFTIDGVPITVPDLYLSSVISIHGIGATFDYGMFGNRSYNTGSSDSLVEQLTIPNFLPSETPLVPLGPSSVSASWCVQFSLVFSVFCSLLAFKIAMNAQSD